MSHQVLNKDNDNVFIQFDRTVELIIELFFVILARNNKSLNIANVISNNTNNEKNDYQFTFDVPTEIEIQKDVEDVLKNEKKPTIATSSLCSATIFNNKRNRDWKKQNKRRRTDERDAANEFADQKNKKIINDIIDPNPGLFISDQLKPNEQNFQKIHHPKSNSSLMIPCLKKL